MALRGAIETYDKDVALAATPEDVAKAAESSSIVTSDVVLKAKASNSQTIFLGDAIAQTWPLIPGEAISISDFLLKNQEAEFDLKNIFVKVGVNGEGFHMLRTKVV